MTNIYIGCAGWSIPSEHAALFPAGDSHLQRYAGRFNAAEINTSFRKPHRRKTYENWAAMTPDGFRFAVKMSKQITHASRLADFSAIGYFLAGATGLGDKLGPLLMQLPPSLAFDGEIAHAFLTALRDRYGGPVVCEPRHASWFSADVDRLLEDFRVARVAADPAPTTAAGQPGGWSGLAYYRLHGAPHIYYSSYSEDYLDNLARTLTVLAESREVWCIFDNTAEGQATKNALGLLQRLAH